MQPGPRLTRFLWFLALWGAGIACVGALAFLIRAVLI